VKTGNALRLLIVLGLVLLIPAANQIPQAAAADQPRVSQQELRDGIEKALAAKALKNASVSILIKSLKNGSVVYDNNPEQPLMPASNMKLVTTATALEKLGKDFKYTTHFYVTAKPDGDGVVNGSLIVIGAGDPNISGRGQASVTALLEAALAQLKINGVKKITGGIIIDDTIFDRQYVHPDWPEDQMDRWYQAEVAGVSFNDNCIDLTLTHGAKAGDPINIAASPATAYITIENTCKTVSLRKNHHFVIARDANTITVSGKFYIKGAAYTTSVPIHAPGLYFGTVLREVLRNGGIPVGGDVSLAAKSYDANADGLTEAATIISNLTRTITVANQRSQNFYAESMLKLLGYKFGTAGSWAEGAKIAASYLDGLGVPDSNYVIRDGCGLSKQNRLTARAIVAVLEHMHSGDLAQTFLDSLAVSGLTDTSLEHRLTEAPYAGRIHGKTGSLNSVSALSGYAENLDGETFAFSIIVNGAPDSAAEQLEDAICRLIVQLKTSE
jgi:D-alanyl-D-alanine carboxypeptidase/D-alanyl-D-alanine-endopeptidase (penicillin-binding protein 4)